MNISIRNYRSNDFQGLLSILHKVYSSNIGKSELEQYYLSDCRSIIVAVNEEEQIVGCTFAEIQEDFIRPNRIMYVTYVAVDEKYRKQGIGKKLLESIEDLCRERQCSAIELTSANFRSEAHRFYEAIGYSKKNTTVFIKELL